MNAVASITPHLSTLQCPDALRALPGWLCWRLEFRDGEIKGRKVPFYANGARRHGLQGRPEDVQQLVTFDAARAAAARRGMDGVGFCPLEAFGILALDFDNCVAPTGLHPDVERAVAGTYAEYSPSGNGVRAFVRGNMGNRKDHGAPFGFELFSTKGFCTFSGNLLELTDITDCTNTISEPNEHLLALCEKRFGRAEAAEAGSSTTEPLGLTEQQLQDALDVLDPSMGHDSWLRMGMALHHETRGEGFDLWDEWSSRGVQYPGRDALQSRWDSFGRGTQRPTTIHALVKLANDNGAHIDIAATAAVDFEVIAEPLAPAADKPNRFTPVQAGQFASGKSPGWLVKDVLPAADLIVMFGESGSGKSFVALDIAAAVARGIPWRARRVKQGRVVYIAAEGGAGFRNRLKAYASVQGIALEDLDIWVIHAQPNMLLKDDALDVCKAIIAIGGASLVIVDTFAQVMPGANENAAEDVGKALANCRGIRTAVKAPVLLVHHSGKDQSRGARGWSGLKAAADAELEILRLPTGRMLRVSKQKDGEDGLAWGFDLDQVPVGADDDGDVITSCVVREADLPVIQQVGSMRRKLGKWETLVVDVINEMAKSQTAGIEMEAVVAEAVRRSAEPETGKRDTRKQHAKRALETLTEDADSPYFIEDGCLSIG